MGREIYPPQTSMFIDDINEKIKYKYGYDFCNRPVFRIVWSDKQTEVRKGTFEKWYGSIYCGSETVIKRVKKYDYISERWILEKLFPNNPESSGIMENFTYEPLFVFQDTKGNYLEPNLRAADLLCWNAMNPNPRNRYRDFNEEQAKEMQKEIDYFTEYLDNEFSFLHMQMKHGEAVVVP